MEFTLKNLKLNDIRNGKRTNKIYIHSYNQISGQDHKNVEEKQAKKQINNFE